MTIKLLRNFQFQIFFFLVVLCVFAPLREIKAQSLSKENEAKIRAVLNSPGLKEAHVGLSILDLGVVENAGSFPAKAPIGKPFRVVFEHDAQKKFMPASNMKLFTAAIALELLGKEKTFPTRVVKCPPVPSFPANSFVLIGEGDPSLDEKGLDDLAAQIKATKVGKIERLIASSNAFGGETFDGRYPFGWTLDDIIWYYGMPVRSLAFNRNQIDVIITGGEKTGDPARCETVPVFDDIGFSVSTGNADLAGKSEEELLHVEAYTLRAQTPWIMITGAIAPRQKITVGLAVPYPASWAAIQFAERLKQAGIEVENANEADFDSLSDLLPKFNEVGTGCTTVAEHHSPPLKILFQRLLKNSDNLYAEMLLRDAAYYHDKTGGQKAAPRAHELLKKWLAAQNIDASSLRFEDGSGLSRYNLLTPRATAELLAAINRMKDGDVIWNALPIAGTDGTMKKRMTSTPSLGNVRAKSGTFSIASNLSGYITTRNNHRLAVALYMNFARDTDTAQKAQDEIFTILAGAHL